MGVVKGNRGSFDSLRSATVWIVKGWLMEKRKTVERFPAFPQPRLRLLAELFTDGSGLCTWVLVLAYFACFGIETDEQLVRHGDAHDSGWFAGSTKALLEVDEIGLVTGHHTADDEQDLANRGGSRGLGSPTATVSPKLPLFHRYKDGRGGV